ncbi:MULTISPECIES: phosphatase PAP2 family protein [unclassified Caballeronia]|uniref:phosphatase PAP2 family protein n=1 Tax=unclassified Caballeronia TaxID=2646786 RepID=UPI0028547397|nr:MULTISPECIES: phosphatase PAP2 family protein [unclassified Caballeronia]MDR5739145.1 phosphatase PAP2 family protein [Caballeronia sp. LZ016]MDR5807633.1 phosphatase PAP2 family protein [Caballeronia sp. LZ019]
MNLDLPFSVWMSITALGGTGVMLPVALAAAAWLALGYRWKYTVEWIALFGIGSSLVALSKIAFIGWGIGIRLMDFTGISGHAYMATSVLPVAMFVALLPARGSIRGTGVLFGLVLGVVVGGSRVVVNAHSVSEVVSGCVLGAAVSLAFVCIAWRAEPGKLSPMPVAASLAVVVVALHGVPVPTQHWITEIALGLSGHPYPYVRALWKSKSYHKPDRRTDVRPIGSNLT